jgi:hypothetical protein
MWLLLLLDGVDDPVGCEGVTVLSEYEDRP